MTTNEGALLEGNKQYLFLCWVPTGRIAEMSQCRHACVLFSALSPRRVLHCITVTSSAKSHSPCGNISNESTEIILSPCGLLKVKCPCYYWDNKKTLQSTMCQKALTVSIFYPNGVIIRCNVVPLLPHSWVGEKVLYKMNYIHALQIVTKCINSFCVIPRCYRTLRVAINDRTRL